MLSTYVGRSLGPQQQVWLAATEKRIAATSKMLSSLKAIKMTSAGERVGAKIEALRVDEYAASKGFRNLLVGSIMSCELS